MQQVKTKEVYTVHLPHFEGPFDLLLFFIERDEIDIYDIPVARVARDFLDYIHSLEAMNLEVASEFILMAGTLMRIKAKMLLPRPVVDEDGNIEDPRTELVNRLLEYKRYKESLDAFRELESESRMRYKRVFAPKEEQRLLQSGTREQELSDIDTYALYRAFKNVWSRHKGRMERPRHVIRPYPYTAEQLKDAIRGRLLQKSKVDFVSFVLDKPERVYCVFAFLAVLEMAQQREIKIIPGRGLNDFWITAAAQAA